VTSQGAAGRMARVPILMYHEVTARPAPEFRKYSVTARAFATQMRWLAAAGYTPVGLDALLDAREGGRPLPRRAVVITFDDGFRDCIAYAAPILGDLGFTATFYLVANLVGRTSAWLPRERGVELPLADWGAVRALAAAGFECGAHTLTHPRLPELSPAACREELAGSRATLEDRLGRPVRHFAYPFGAYNEAVRAAADEAGYRSAVSVRLGLSAPDDDRLALRRVPVLGSDSLLDFVCRLRSARSAPETFRRGVRRAARTVAAGLRLSGRMT
jgi:peptidoglycan/xylan/chitin deacetylase (PgdA/CDA1 family)